MKTMTLTALTLCLAACDAGAPEPTDDANTPAAAGKADGAAEQPEAMSFSRDARPVDGALVQIDLTRNERGSYDATLLTSYFDRIAGEEVENTETLGLDLDCTFDLDAEIFCARDDRPVDGDLVELSLVLDDDGTWDATRRRAYFDRIAHEEVDETEEIATGLRPDKAADARLAVFARDDRPVDGVLTELRVTEAGAGTYDVELRTAYFDRIAHEEVDEVEVLATGLACEFDAWLYCWKDRMPVDGALTEIFVWGAKKNWSAVIGNTYWDRFEGELVQEYDWIADGLELIDG